MIYNLILKMSSIVQRANQLSINNVVFSKLKKQGKGGYVSFVNCKNSSSGKTQRLIVQFPKMFAPFGATCFTKDVSADQLLKYNLLLSLDENLKEVTDLKNFLLELDELVCEQALSNKEWKEQLSNKVKSKIMAEAFYSPVVKKSTTSYPDNTVLKVPIDWKEKQPALQLYGKNKDKLDVTFDNIEQLLPKFSELKCLVQISHVWFVSKKFGVTLKLLQSIVHPKETLSDFALVDSEDEDKEESEVEEVE